MRMLSLREDITRLIILKASPNWRSNSLIESLLPRVPSTRAFFQSNGSQCWRRRSICMDFFHSFKAEQRRGNIIRRVYKKIFGRMLPTNLFFFNLHVLHPSLQLLFHTLICVATSTGSPKIPPSFQKLSDSSPSDLNSMKKMSWSTELSFPESTTLYLGRVTDTLFLSYRRIITPPLA